uniref:Uncharacterized protein n=1 Tax=Acrobeloides nanus TaxID=290746 RepID=A0A914EN48_9BILA
MMLLAKYGFSETEIIDIIDESSMQCEAYTLIYDVYERDFCYLMNHTIMYDIRAGECFRINTVRLMEEGSFIRRLYGYEVFKMNEKDKKYSMGINFGMRVLPNSNYGMFSVEFALGLMDPSANTSIIDTLTDFSLNYKLAYLSPGYHIITIKPIKYELDNDSPDVECSDSYGDGLNQCYDLCDIKTQGACNCSLDSYYDFGSVEYWNECVRNNSIDSISYCIDYTNRLELYDIGTRPGISVFFRSRSRLLPVPKSRFSTPIYVRIRD